MKFFKILLIEDDADDIVFFKYAIKQLNELVRVNIAENGEAALDLLRSNLSDLPDCIVLDLNMPKMNGFECLKRLKSDSNYKKIPVIILSTSANFEDKERAYNLGAESYIVKPPTIQELKSELKKVL